LKSLWPTFLANSPDLLFSNGPLTRTPHPITIQNHWFGASSTSQSLPSRFRFGEIPCCPSCNVHSSRSFCCCCITRTIVDFGTPVISASWRWLVLGGCF
jgi:hypothetical protein